MMNSGMLRISLCFAHAPMCSMALVDLLGVKCISSEFTHVGAETKGDAWMCSANKGKCLLEDQHLMQPE